MKKRLVSVLCILSLLIILILSTGAYAASDEPEQLPIHISGYDGEWVTEGLSGVRVDSADEALALLTGSGQPGIRSFGAAKPVPTYTLKDTVESSADRSKAYKFQQTYRDIPVYGMIRIVNTDKNGYVHAISGDCAPDIVDMLLAATPGLSAAQAKAIVITDLGLTNPEFNTDTCELIYFMMPIAGKPLYHLTYRVAVCGHDESRGFFSWVIMVDAADGSILEREDRIGHLTGTGSYIWGDRRNFTCVYEAGKYVIKDPGRNFQTLNMLGTTSSMYLIKSDTMDFGYTPGADAAYFAEKTYDFYNTFGWRGMTGAGNHFDVLVGYGDPGTNAADKAFQSGSDLVFGSGNWDYDRGPYEAMVDLCTAHDVVAHEYTHGVTEHSAGLVYHSIAGALNEAISDIMGTLAEGKSSKSEGFYLIGEDAMMYYHTGIRSLKNPEDYGLPSTMNQYVHTTQDDGGVHTNMGIPSKAFYTMSRKISTDKLAQIWFGALTQYLTPYSDFWDARNATVEEANTLYGSKTGKIVASAWDSVGVYAESPDLPGDTRYEAVSLAPNSTVPGSINWGGDRDFYQITPANSAEYIFSTTGSTDTYGFLYNSGGRELRSNNDYSGRNFRIQYDLDAGQIYYLLVRHDNKDYGYGDYTLNCTADIDAVSDLTVTPSKSSPQEIGMEIAFTSQTGYPGAVEYRVEIKEHESASWLTVQPYGQKNQYNWDPAKIGVYDIRISARAADRTNDADRVWNATYRITEITPQAGVTLSSSMNSGEKDAAITFTAIPQGPASLTDRAQYQFRLKQGRKWKTVQTWSNDNTYEWTPTKVGTYDLEVQSRTMGRTTIDRSYKIDDFPVAYPPELDGVVLSAEPGPSSEKGTDIELTAAPSGDQSYRAEYLFRIKRGRRWSTLRGWSPDKTYTWKPTKTGDYTIEVQARTHGRPSADKTASTDYTVVDIYPLEEVTLSGLEPGMQPAGTQITLSAAAQGPHADKAEYLFHYSTDGRKWRSIGNGKWTDSPEAEYTPEKDAVYQFRVQARSPGRSGVDVEDIISQRFYLGPMLVEDVTLTVVDPSGDIQETGETVKLVAEAQGEAAGDAEYLYRIKRGRRWTKLRGWDSAGTYDWEPDREGAYTIEVQARTHGRSGIDAAADTAYTIVDVFPLTGVTLTGTPSGMQEAGTEINLEAAAEGCYADNAEYAFQYSTDGRRWKTFRRFDETASAAFTPDREAVYYFRVQARSPGRSGVDVEDVFSQRFYAGAMPVEEVKLEIEPSGTQEVQRTVVLRATAHGDAAGDAEYLFRVKLGRRWTTVRDWSNAPTYEWTPDRTGTYTVEVQTRNRDRKGTDAVDTAEGYAVVLPPSLDGVDLRADRPSPREINKDIILTAEAQGDESETSRAEYLFRAKLGKRWSTLQDWSTNGICLWMPEKTGTYTIEVQTRTKGRPKTDVSAQIGEYTIELPPELTEVELTASADSPQEIGTSVTLSAKGKIGESESDRALYLFRVKRGRRWSTLQNWSEEASCPWEPKKTGTYTIEVQARTEGRPKTDVSVQIDEYEIELPPELTGVELTASADSPQETGTSVMLSARGKIGENESDRALYLFRVKLGRRWSTLQNWSEEASCAWEPEKTGTYIIEVQARTEGRPKTDVSAQIDEYEIELPPELTEVEVTASVDSPQETGTSVMLSARGKIGENESDRALYLFRVKRGRRWSTLQNWSEEASCAWEPEKTGTYTIEVQARTEGRPKTDVSAQIDEYEIELPPKLTEVELTASADSPQEIGTSVMLNAKGKIGENESDRALYLFQVKRGRRWSTLQNWSEEASCAWEPEKTGTCTIEVQARTKGRPKADTSAAVSYTITDILPVGFVELLTTPEVGVVDEPTTVTAAADRPYAEYRFLCRQGDGPYELLQEWSAGADCVWTPAVEGKYTLLVLSRARQQNTVQVVRTLVYRVLAVPPVRDVAIETDPEGGQELGGTVEIVAQADQPDAEYEFAYSPDGSVYTTVQDFSADASFTWEPDATGVYYWRVRARSDTSFPQGQAEGLMEYRVYTEIAIPDGALRDGLKNVLGKTPDDSLTNLDMASLTDLDCSGWGIEDLTGIDYAMNIADLDLSDNRILDLAPLQTLIDEGGLAGTGSRLDITLNGLDCRESAPVKSLIDTWADAGIAISYLPQHPIVGSVTLTTDMESPGDVGAVIHLSAQSDQPGVEYRFTVDDTLLEDWTDDDTVVWTPDAAGVHTLTVQARTWGIPETEVTDSIQYEVLPAPLSGVSMEVVPAGSSEQGNEVTLSAASEAGAWYRFQAMREDGEWFEIGNWSQSNTIEWLPERTGDFTLRVQAHRDGRPADCIDVSDTIAYSVISLPITGDLGIAVSPESPQELGAAVTVSVNDLGPDAEYWFGVQNSEEVWVWTAEWGAETSASWTPDSPGIYLVFARARAQGRDGHDMEDTIVYTVTPPPIGAVLLSIEPESPHMVSAQVTLTAESEGSNPEYCFSVKAEDGDFENIQDWRENKIATWTPDAPGTYTLRVQARETGQSVVTAEASSISLVSWPSLESLALDIDETITSQYEPRQLTATANTDYAEFKFSVHNPDDSWSILQEWSKDATCGWTPSVAGEYVLQVEGRGLGRIGSDHSASMTISVYPSPPMREWSAYLGGSGMDESKAVRQTSDGGFILAGYTRSADVPGYNDPNGLSDAYLIKADSIGNMQWQFCRGGDRNDILRDVIQTADGGFLAVGQKEIGSYAYVYFVKVSAQGYLDWEKSYGGAGRCDANSIIKTGDGNYCITGYVCDTGFSELSGLATKKIATGTDGFVLKINENGQLVWLEYYGGNGTDRLYDIVELSDGSMILAGDTRSTDLNHYHDNGDGWVVKMDSSGTLQWQRAIGGNSQDCFYSACTRRVAGQERIEIVGTTQSQDGDVPERHGAMDGYLVGIDSAGGIYHTICLGGSNNEQLKDISSTKDQGLILLGYTTSKDGSLSDTIGNGLGWMVRINSNNQVLWQKRVYDMFGGGGYICGSNDGGSILSGSCQNSNQAYGSLGESNFLLTKLSPEGVMMPFFSEMAFDRQSPQAAGTSITVTGISNLDGVEYRFLCYDETGNETVLQDWNTDATVEWTPNAAGVYVIKTQARVPQYAQYVESDILQFNIQ